MSNNSAVSRRIFVRFARAVALIASVVCLIQPLPAQVNGQARLVVKLRHPLSDEMEAALPLKTMALTSGQGASPRVQAFFAQHRPNKISALYPALVRMKKRQGLSDSQLADTLRQKYPERASRLHEAFNPPEIARSYTLNVTAGSHEELLTILSQLNADPDVEFAEEDKVVSINFTPNDPYFLSYGSWGQPYDDLWGVKLIGSPAAWDTTAGEGIVVAVVDTGIDYNHPDIAANVWVNTKEIPNNGIDDDGNGYVDDVRGWDFIGPNYWNPTQDNNVMDGFGHGTHVAGTIAAVGNNGIGVIGVAWQAQVMAVKGLDNSGYGLDSTLGPALIYAANNGAEIISNSWAGQGTSQTIAEAVSYAYNLGAVIVAAAGNNSDDARNYYPANLPQVITVAATDHTDNIAYFSNWGDKIDVAAPGVDILSLRASGTSMGTPVDAYYTRADGTSMATPHVSGLAALVLSANPQFSNEDVRQALRSSAYNNSKPFNFIYGYGRINAAQAVLENSVLASKILSPTDGAHIQGPTSISGLAMGTGFSQYMLLYGAGDLPTNWTVIQTGTSRVSGGTLGIFDPSRLPDGKYTIQLRTCTIAGCYFDQTEVVVDYVSITSPVPPVVPVTASVFKPGTLLSISGTATGPSFQDFRLDWAEGFAPSSGWSTTGMTSSNGGISPVSNGVVGSWDTSSITQADYYTIRLSVDNSGFTSIAETIVYLEPSLLSGNWPKWLNVAPGLNSGAIPARDSSLNWHLTLQSPYTTSLPAQFWNFSADGSSQNISQIPYGTNFGPAAGDLDGVSGDEVASAEAFQLDIFHLDNTFYSFLPGIFGNFQFAQVVLEDLNADSEFETIALGNNFSAQTASIFAWRRDGTQLNSNFPITIPDQNSNLVFPQGPRVLVGDVDGDGSRELVVQEGVSSSTFTLGLFGSNGSAKTWNSPVFNGYPTQMILADLDHNGSLETILLCMCNAQAQLHVLQPDGTERAGWPVTLASNGYLAVGDINRDGTEEIAVSAYNSIYLFEPNGISFSSAWPLTVSLAGSGTGPFGPVILADVDGDGFPEIVTTRDQYSFANNPLLPAGTSASSSATVSKSTAQAPKRLLSTQVVTNTDGVTALQPRVSASTQSNSQNSYYQPQVVAFHPDGTIVRSWNLLGANGNQPFYLAKLTAGDFNKDGITDIAAVYWTITGGGISGYLTEGVATVLSTGGTYNASANDWSMIYQNPRNTAVLIRDHTPPTVSVTSPIAGATVTGQITVTANASDNVAVAGVQFQLDGANLGSLEMTAPFSVAWDTTQVSAGSHTLTAVATDTSGNSAVCTPVSVTVQPPISANMSPATLSFGNQIIGTTSSAQTITVTNTGGAILTVSAVQVAGDFAQASNCVGSIAVGGNCTIQVTFSPTLRGSESGSVILAGNFTGSAPTASLTGTGQAQQASFNPTSLNLGGTPIGSSSYPMNIYYINNGDVPLNTTGVSTTGDFSQTNNCAAVLNAGASCLITVTFNPTVRGPETGTLSVSGTVNLSATLSGTGQALLATITPSSLTFGNQQVGIASAAQLVTVSNTGDAPFYINQWGINGAFSAVNNCPFNIPVNSSCNFSVTFSPTSSGSYTGVYLQFYGNFNGSPAKIPISGVGTVPATITPTSLAFGNQIIGTTSAVQTITVTNNGTSWLQVNGVQVTGDFTQSNNCIGAVSAGASCNIQVTFTPTLRGAENGSLILTGNFNSGSPTIALSGTGQARQASFSPTSLSFSGQPIGYVSSPLTVTYSNMGDVSVSISSISSTGDFSQANNCPASLNAGANCTISVTFTPSVRGAETGTLSLGGTVPATVSLSGTGLALLATISPKSLAYGNQQVGTVSPAQLVTVTDTGDSPFTISQWTVGGPFSVVDNCPSTVPLNTGCTFSVTFAPTASGTASGTLTISGNFSGSPATVSLSGSATLTAATISPTTLTYSSQIVSTSSGSKSLTLTNTGGTAVSISGIQIAGDFSQTNNCASSLAVNAHCTINVVFTPATSGTRTGTLTVNSNSIPMVSTVSLNGTGLDYSLSASPSSATVNAGTSTSYTITVQALGGTYNSSISLNCSGLPASSSCSFSPSSLTPGSGKVISTMKVSTTARNGNKGTPAGTYTLTVTGSSGNLKHTTTVSLTVN